MNRVKTGISGLDNVLEGFPKGRTILVTGNAGSGKTIFGLQFANESCAQGLKTIYLATEENMNDLEIQASSFGWKFDQYKKTGLFELVELTSSRLKEIEAAANIRIDDKKGDFMGLLDLVGSGTKVLIIDSLGSHT